MVVNVLPPTPTWTDDDMEALILDERRSCRRLDDAELTHYGRMARLSLNDPKGCGPPWYRVWMSARVRACAREWRWRHAEVDASYARSYREWVQDAKKRVDLLDLVGLPARSRVIHCPLHDDKHASCSLDADKGLWWCFVCQLGGDVLSWLALVEGLEWADALDRLEQLSGLQKPKRDPKEIRGVAVARVGGRA